MDVSAILKVDGEVLRDFGFSNFTFNPDRTLQKKEVFSDAARTELMYRKSFFWNADDTLNRWELFVQSTGETIVRRFFWDADLQLERAEFDGVEVC